MSVRSWQVTAEGQLACREVVAIKYQATSIGTRSKVLWLSAIRSEYTFEQVVYSSLVHRDGTEKVRKLAPAFPFLNLVLTGAVTQVSNQK
ncbi:MAG: hypothetical protein ACI9R3_005042 [Verrucomicrobiales bacterium]